MFLLIRGLVKQIQLYNNMVEKKGTPEEDIAREAYRHAREDSDHAAEAASGTRVSSALIAKVLMRRFPVFEVLDLTNTRTMITCVGLARYHLYPLNLQIAKPKL